MSTGGIPTKVKIPAQAKLETGPPCAKLLFSSKSDAILIHPLAHSKHHDLHLKIASRRQP